MSWAFLKEIMWKITVPANYRYKVNMQEVQKWVFGRIFTQTGNCMPLENTKATSKQAFGSISIKLAYWQLKGNTYSAWRMGSGCITTMEANLNL